MSEKETILYYKGTLTFQIIGDLINELRDKAIINGLSMRLYKRMLSAMIESIENVYKYISGFNEDLKINENHASFLSIEKIDSEYIIRTGNPIYKTDVVIVKKLIDRINNFNIEELRDLYKEIVKNNQFSEKGGAGLGLIEIAKSGNKIKYEFEDIDKDLSFYTLNINIEK